MNTQIGFNTTPYHKLLDQFQARVVNRSSCYWGQIWMLLKGV